MRSILGGKLDKKSVIFPFVALSTQSFICCRFSRTAGSESYTRLDSIRKSCFGWKPEMHNLWAWIDNSSSKHFFPIWVWEMLKNLFPVKQTKKKNVLGLLLFPGVNLDAGRCASQSAGHCFGDDSWRYAETLGNRAGCFHGGGASTAPWSRLLRLQDRGAQ